MGAAGPPWKGDHPWLATDDGTMDRGDIALVVYAYTYETLLVKSQICRKPLGHAIFETRKDRDLTPVKRVLATVEILLPRLNQQSLLWPCLS
jgi:hypothetical protein